MVNSHRQLSDNIFPFSWQDTRTVIRNSEYWKKGVQWDYGKEWQCVIPYKNEKPSKKVEIEAPIPAALDHNYIT